MPNVVVRQFNGKTTLSGSVKYIGVERYGERCYSTEEIKIDWVHGRTGGLKWRLKSHQQLPEKHLYNSQSPSFCK